MRNIVTTISEFLYKVNPRAHFQFYKIYTACLNNKPAFQFMKNHIREGDTVFDVGANIGMYSHIMGGAVGNSGKVYSFEANSKIAKEFSVNNKSKHIELIEQAVTEKEGEKPFYVHLEKYAPTSSLEIIPVLHDENLVIKKTVSCTSIDAFCKKHNLQPKFIKIDVEGHEIGVFRGAVNTIRELRPILLFEFVDAWYEEKGLNKIIEFLKPMYTLIRVENGDDVISSYKDFTPPVYDDLRNAKVCNIGCLPKQIDPFKKELLDESILW